MDQIDEFVDERLKGVCIFCGESAGGSRDHVPSKGLLRRPLPDNLPVVDVCGPCNKGFSADEEYFSLLLHSVLVGSTNPEAHYDERIARGLRRHKTVRNRIEGGKVTRTTPSGAAQIEWTPEPDRVNRVVVKNARGHVCYEYGIPITAPPRLVGSLPLQVMSEEARSEFFDTGPLLSSWPEVGCRMMTRVVTGQDLNDAGWIVVQEGVYEYSVDDWDSYIRVRSKIHDYLGTVVCWESGE